MPDESCTQRSPFAIVGLAALYMNYCSHLLSTSRKSEASLVAQMVKNLPAMQEIWVQSLGQENPLEKGMATYSSILA